MALDDEDVYVKHAEELLRFAATLVGPSLAEDVVASAVVRAFSSPSWPTVRAHRAYLYRAVLNEARQTARTHRRRILREATVAPPEALAADQVRVDVLDALRRLSLRQRAVVFLTYWADLSAGEAAEVLHVSRATAERDLRVAKTRLKEMLR
jgi:RNA polymerase sigma-70 factor (ECF subfamily)